MLVTFRCKAHGDVMMFGDIAEQLIKMMGYSGVVPGAIYADDLSVALERLQNAIKSEADTGTLEEKGDEKEKDEPPVSLAVRAFPLVEMLNAAVRKNCNVMWTGNRS